MYKNRTVIFFLLFLLSFFFQLKMLGRDGQKMKKEAFVDSGSLVAEWNRSVQNVGNRLISQ
jgi:hypothetical protein